MSLLGQPLLPPAADPAARRRAELQLEEARVAFDREPSLDNTIWYGRRAAYLYQYHRAIAIFGEGLRQFPNSYALYRHRGHRYITTRQFERAVADLRRAAELAADQPVLPEPDGMPNRLNQPRSSGHFNIWYHLGLAHYLLRSFAEARAAYEQCLQSCDNDDSLTATADWLWMSCMRLGDRDAADAILERIRPEMDLVEDESYHRRLLLYKGLLAPEQLLEPAADSSDRELALVTQGYGVGNWYLVGGEPERAATIFRQVLATGSWPAFGYIAAEVELAHA
jgi:tetratricopeptide (TPR) repeat protein